MPVRALAPLGGSTNFPLAYLNYMKYFAQDCGLEVDDDYFTSWMATQVEKSFTIPKIDSDDFPTYKDVFQEVLTSNFSFIATSDQGKLIFEYFDPKPAQMPAPWRNYVTITEDDIVKDSLASELDLIDIRTHFTTYNPYYR